MTTPELTHAREQSLFHLETLELVTDMIRDTFPAAATLHCHRQMRDILIRIRDIVHHPILFAAHIIVYLVRAARYSRRWATLVKNLAALDPLLLNRHSSAPSSPSSVLVPPPSLPSTPSVAVRVRPCPSQPLPPSIPSIPSPPCASSHSSSLTLPPSSFHHSLETRLRIRAFAQALQHERHIAQKLPPSVPKPDLTPILPSRHRPSVLSSQPPGSRLKTQVSRLLPPPPLFPSEAFWESKVRGLQLKILGNITRILPALGRAYLKQYNASISSTPSSSPLPSSFKPQASSLKSQASHPSHPSHPSHSSPPHPSSLQLQDSRLKIPDSGLTPLSHPPPPQSPPPT